jgi:hypothetical protein
MDRLTLRHIMAAIIVADELKVPSIRAGDPFLSDERLHKQFTGMVHNAYCVVDLMLEVGESRLQQQQQYQQQYQLPQYMEPAPQPQYQPQQPEPQQPVEAQKPAEPQQQEQPQTQQPEQQQKPPDTPPPPLQGGPLY